jgi:hypothetical protein
VVRPRERFDAEKARAFSFSPCSPHHPPPPRHICCSRTSGSAWHTTPRPSPSPTRKSQPPRAQIALTRAACAAVADARQRLHSRRRRRPPGAAHPARRMRTLIRRAPPRQPCPRTPRARVLTELRRPPPTPTKAPTRAIASSLTAPLLSWPAHAGRRSSGETSPRSLLRSRDPKALR